MTNPAFIRDTFQELGYVVVQGLLDPDHDLRPLMLDYYDLLDQLAEKWVQDRLIPSTFSELPFDERFIKITSCLGENWAQYFDILLPAETKPDTPLHLSLAVFNLIRNQAILDVIEALIGPEIYSNPIQHVRIKPPQRMVHNNDKANAMIGQTAWHQDQGAALPEADGTEIVTVWLPLTEASEENSCMRVIPGQHHKSLLTHCPVLTIPEKLLQHEEVVLPMQPGDVLFMHRLIPHASTPNTSNQVRWSFDLRYHPVGQPTGRPALPGFVARSEKQPDKVLESFDSWVSLWGKARENLIENGPFQLHRWDGNEPACA
ncbi:MAG: phytanoyl-CoA dioxygenase family protein [Chloroflexota bacterium]